MPAFGGACQSIAGVFFGHMQEVLEQVGEDGICSMVAAFYRRVKDDELIGPMYPDGDWEGSEGRLAGFLVYRFGGSDRYIRERGHPRLRMRHAPFSIGEAERDRWMEHMRAAMAEVEVPEPSREIMDAFFAQVADMMRNREG